MAIVFTYQFSQTILVQAKIHPHHLLIPKTQPYYEKGDPPVNRGGKGDRLLFEALGCAEVGIRFIRVDIWMNL